jgi:carboxyl-terminal processing protease
VNRSRLSFLLLSIAVLLPLVAGAVLARGDEGDDDSLFKYLSVFQDVLRLVRQAYVEDVSVDQLMEGALEGAGDALDDFTTYVPASEVEAYRHVLATGDRHSGVAVAKDRGVVYVVSVTPGSPAAAAGLERGDILTAIAGESTHTMPLWRAQSIFAGEPGLRVGISLLRDGVAEEAELTLATFEPPLVNLTEHDGVAVVEIAVLGEGTDRALRSALETLTAGGAPEGLLIDLRETVSANVEAAYQVGRYFAAGDLGKLSSLQGVIRTFLADGEPMWSGSLVVLLGHGTIGAAEVLTSVLQQAAGATVVGQPSYGYAGRLTLRPLSNGAHVLMTDAFYSGPGGEPIRESLLPDIEVGDRSRTYAEKDLALDELTLRRAVEVLRGEAMRDAA